MYRHVLLFSLLLTVGIPVQARVYQWVDPHSGNVYLSGSPPGWYRSGAPGPRVLVYEGGKLVDDTYRETSEEEEQALREQAMLEQQRRQEEAAGEARREEEASAGAGEPEAAPVEPGAEARAQAETAFANYLKSLVSEYFRSAGGLPGTGPITPAPAPPP
jgi:hypothetical protein